MSGKPESNEEDDDEELDEQSSRKFINPSYWYTNQDIHFLLQQELNDTATVCHAVPFTEASADRYFKDNLQTAFSCLRPNKPAVIPIHLGGNHWAGLMVRMQENGRIQVFYNDPLGHLMPRKLQHIIKEVINVPIVTDLCIVQQEDGNDCGPFTVDNLVKLVQASEEDLVTLVKSPGSSKQSLLLRGSQAARTIRKQHARHSQPRDRSETAVIAPKRRLDSIARLINGGDTCTTVSFDRGCILVSSNVGKPNHLMKLYFEFFQEIARRKLTSEKIEKDPVLRARMDELVEMSIAAYLQNPNPEFLSSRKKVQEVMDAIRSRNVRYMRDFLRTPLQDLAKKHQSLSREIEKLEDTITKDGTVILGSITNLKREIEATNTQIMTLSARLKAAMGLQENIEQILQKKRDVLKRQIDDLEKKQITRVQFKSERVEIENEYYKLKMIINDEQNPDNIHELTRETLKLVETEQLKMQRLYDDVDQVTNDKDPGMRQRLRIDIKKVAKWLASDQHEDRDSCKAFFDPFREAVKRGITSAEDDDGVYFIHSTKGKHSEMVTIDYIRKKRMKQSRSEESTQASLAEAVQSVPADDSIYLGLSKLCCLDCDCAVHALNAVEPEVVCVEVRGTHNRSYDSESHRWVAPEYFENVTIVTEFRRQKDQKIAARSRTQEASRSNSESSEHEADMPAISNIAPRLARTTHHDCDAGRKTKHSDSDTDEDMLVKRRKSSDIELGHLTPSSNIQRPRSKSAPPRFR